MATGDVYLCAIRAVQNGQPVVSTWALRREVSPEPAAADFTSILTSVKNLLRLQQVDDLVYVDWTALQVRGAGVTYNTSAPFRVSTVSYSGALTGTLPGLLTAEPEAMQAAMVLSLTTAQSGRRRRGRVFMGGIAVTQVADDGTLDNTNRTNAQTATADAIVALLGPSGTSTDWRLGVWSDRIATNTVLSNTWPRIRVTAGTPDPANAWAQVESIIIRDYVGNQRDRRPGI